MFEYVKSFMTNLSFGNWLYASRTKSILVFFLKNIDALCPNIGQTFFCGTFLSDQNVGILKILKYINNSNITIIINSNIIKQLLLN